MVESVDGTVTIESAVVSVDGGSDLLVGRLSDFGLFGNGRSQQNSQDNLIVITTMITFIYEFR